MTVPFYQTIQILSEALLLKMLLKIFRIKINSFLFSSFFKNFITHQKSYKKINEN